MRIVVDMDPRDVWRIEAAAERDGVTSGEILRAELATHRGRLELRNRVRARVLAGMCDADIAEELSRSPGTIAALRRAQGLRANPRYPAKTNQRRTA